MSETIISTQLNADNVVSIQSITALETDISNLNNVITVTLTDGNSTEFNIKNGKDGKDGKDGTNGVSLGEVALINNLYEGGTDKVLTAELGKVIGNLIYDKEVIAPNILESGKMIDSVAHSNLGAIVSGGAYRIEYFNVNNIESLTLTISGNYADGFSIPIASAWYSDTPSIETYINSPIISQSMTPERTSKSDGTYDLIVPTNAKWLVVTLLANSGKCTVSIPTENVRFLTKLNAIENIKCDVLEELNPTSKNFDYYLENNGNQSYGKAHELILYTVEPNTNYIITFLNLQKGSSIIPAGWYSTLDINSVNLFSFIGKVSGLPNLQKLTNGNYNITSPANAQSLVVVNLKSHGGIIKLLKIKNVEAISNFNERITNLENNTPKNTILAKYLLNPINNIIGKYIDNLDHIIKDGSAHRLIIYSIDSNKKYRLSLSGQDGGSSTPMAAAWYSSTELLDLLENPINSVFLSNAIRKTQKQSNGTYDLVPPENAESLVITLCSAGVSTLYETEEVNGFTYLQNEIEKLSAASEQKEIPDRHLHLLCIGNSYSYDALAYLPALLKKIPNLTFTIGICMDGSLNLQGHYNKARLGNVYTRYSRNQNGNGWETFSQPNNNTKNLELVLTSIECKPKDKDGVSTDWDYIILHERSGADSCKYEQVKTNLTNLINWIKAKGYNGKFGWLTIPAFPDGTVTREGIDPNNKLKTVSRDLGLDYTLTSDELEKRIMEVGNKIVKEFKMHINLPCGIALLNARLTKLNFIGECITSEENLPLLMYKDGHHLEMGIANLVEAWAAAIALFQDNCIFEDIETNIKWPNGDRMSSDNLPQGLESDNLAIARMCAKVANVNVLNNWIK